MSKLWSAAAERSVDAALDRSGRLILQTTIQSAVKSTPREMLARGPRPPAHSKYNKAHE